MDRLSLWKLNYSKGGWPSISKFRLPEGFHFKLDKVFVPNNTFQTSQVKFNHHLTFNDMAGYQHDV